MEASLSPRFGTPGSAGGSRAAAAGAVRPGADIEVEAVTHRYGHSGAPVLQDINARIRPGEAVAIVGRSGCGKSTLLHIIGGFAQPTEGCVRIDGERVIKPSPRCILMFQQPSLFPWATVADNVALGLKFNGRQGEAKERVAQLLDLVELSAYANRNVQDLSGGQQQRVALARSLALSPEALLLDEPFSALDTFTRKTLQRDVRRIARELGLTLVFVTHDLDEAAMMADRAFIMSANPGRVRTEVTVRPAGMAGGAEGYEQAKRALIVAYEGAAGLAMSTPGADWSI